MARPAARVLQLLELLESSSGTRTVADLADRLGVDERTVRRHVEHLVEPDVPVRSVRGRHGGIVLGRAHRVPPLMLTDEEDAPDRPGPAPRTGVVLALAPAAR